MRISALLAATAMLAACNSGSGLRDAFDSRQNAGACPPAGSVYTASRVVELSDPESPTFNNISYTGEIVDVRLFCRYASDEPVRAEIEVDFAFGKGPQATSNTHDYTYWVAVTRRSGKVLNKERFTVRADFGNGDVIGASELVQRIVIPRADTTISAANFEVLVGFELTEDQVEFNKNGQRFRLGAGQ
ncbi:MAG: hypothetical protein ABNH53_03815 [Henriciella sp.]|jgi:hypothetical protein